jgi:hypothetical protein
MQNEQDRKRPAHPMPRRSISLGFTSEPCPEGQHFCHIFGDDEARLNDLVAARPARQ